MGEGEAYIHIIDLRLPLKQNIRKSHQSYSASS
jgi:hypothetical protein